VNIVFLLVIVAVIALSTYLGITAVGQGWQLVTLVDRSAERLPEIIESLPSEVSVLSLEIDLAALRIDDALRALSGALGQAVTTSVDLLSGVLSGVISVLSLGLFVLVLTYFLLRGIGPDVSVSLRIRPDDPGYRYDLQRGQRELSRIWRAYLGGQITLSLLTFVLYLSLLSVLGVREAFVLAMLAALARFVPYVGAAITWSVTAVVVFFQAANYLGLEPWVHTLVVLVVVILVDQIIDQVVMPRIMSNALGVHPAAVMVAVIAGAQLLGVVGLVLAAPVLASAWLGARYAMRKMLDANPWPDAEPRGDDERSMLKRVTRRWRRPAA
jgi:predicted PurR-regulated permease PerM